MPCLSGPMTCARGGAVRFRANRALCCLKASGDPAEQRARGRRHAPPLPPDLRAIPGRRCAARRLAGMPGLGLGDPDGRRAACGRRTRVASAAWRPDVRAAPAVGSPAHLRVRQHRIDLGRLAVLRLLNRVAPPRRHGAPPGVARSRLCCRRTWTWTGSRFEAGPSRERRKPQTTRAPSAFGARAGARASSLLRGQRAAQRASAPGAPGCTKPVWRERCQHLRAAARRDERRQ